MAEKLLMFRYRAPDVDARRRSERMHTVLQHLEAHLGPFDADWSDSCSRTDIRVVRFLDQPLPETTTYCTLGLSHYDLRNVHDEDVRMELIFSTYSRYDSEEVAAFLGALADFLRVNGRGLGWGDVVTQTDEILFGTSATAVCAAGPSLFDERFATCSTTPPTAMTWTIPLSSAEADFVRAAGWRGFERRCRSRGSNLLDLNRAPIVP